MTHLTEAARIAADLSALGLCELAFRVRALGSELRRLDRTNAALIAEMLEDAAIDAEQARQAEFVNALFAPAQAINDAGQVVAWHNEGEI